MARQGGNYMRSSEGNTELIERTKDRDFGSPDVKSKPAKSTKATPVNSKNEDK